MSNKKKRLQDASASPLTSAPWLWYLAIALLTLLLFGRVLGFVYLVPGEGTRILSAEKLTTAPDWAAAFSTLWEWQPLAWLSLLTDFALFGPKAEAQRLVSLLLHLANSLLVFAVFRRFTHQTAQAGIAALLFAIHPLRIEPLIWLTERRTLLCAFFALLALRAYAEFTTSSSRRTLWGAAVFLATLLAALSHPAGAVLPLLLLLIDIWPLQRTEPLATRIIEKAPLALISLFTAIMSARGAVNPEALWTNGTLDTPTRLYNALAGLGTASLRALLPFPLDIYPTLNPPAWTLAGLLLLPALAFFLRSRAATVAVAWFYLALLPAIGLLHPEISPWRDSATYLAAIGLTAGLVFALSAWDRDKFTAIALLAGLLWSGLAWLRTSEWALGETLLRVSTERGNHPLAHYQLGQLLIQTGRAAESEKHLRAVVTARPQYIDGRLVLAAALAGANRRDEAAAQLQEAIRLAPQRPDAYFSLGMLQTTTGNGAEGAKTFAAAIARGLTPEQEAQAQNAIGVYHLNDKRPADALPHLERAWKLAPKYASAHANFSRALIALGRCRQAIAYLNRARLYTNENQEVVDVWTDAFNCNAANEKKEADAAQSGK